MTYLLIIAEGDENVSTSKRVNTGIKAAQSL